MNIKFTQDEYNLVAVVTAKFGAITGVLREYNTSTQTVTITDRRSITWKIAGHHILRMENVG